MTLATLYITLLRVIHISAAVTWIGGAIFLVSVLIPTVQASGPDGGRFMLHLASVGRMTRTLTAAGVLTVLAGLLLYWPTSGHLSSAWLTSGHGISLTIGAIFGLLALLDGLFGVGPTARKMGAIATDILSRQGPPPPELLQQAQALGAKLSSGAMRAAALGSLALFFMAAAQTL